MESKLARILKCRFFPVALTRTDSRSENALSFRPGRGGLHHVAFCERGQRPDVRG